VLRHLVRIEEKSFRKTAGPSHLASDRWLRLPRKKFSSVNTDKARAPPVRRPGALGRHNLPQQSRDGLAFLSSAIKGPPPSIRPRNPGWSGAFDGPLKFGQRDLVLQSTNPGVSAGRFRPSRFHDRCHTRTKTRLAEGRQLLELFPGAPESMATSAARRRISNPSPLSSGGAEAERRATAALATTTSRRGPFFRRDARMMRGCPPACPLSAPIRATASNRSPSPTRPAS